MNKIIVLLDRAYHRKYSFSFRRFPDPVLFDDMLAAALELESAGERCACATRQPAERSDFFMACTVQ
jgi:hypothetical protein